MKNNNDGRDKRLSPYASIFFILLGCFTKLTTKAGCIYPLLRLDSRIEKYLDSGLRIIGYAKPDPRSQIPDLGPSRSGIWDLDNNRTTLSHSGA